MLSYAVRRALLVIPVVLGSISLLFVVFFVVPGDPVDQMAGGERAVSPAVRRNIERRYGLDKPFHERYVTYLGNLAQGDLGESYQKGRSVNDILKEKAPASLRLALWGMVIEVIIGIIAGLVAAVKRYSFVDAVTTVSTTMVVAIPVFLLGYIFQYMLGVYAFQHDFPAWARFPVQGAGPDSWTFFFIPTGSQWRFLLLPALTVAATSTALVARMMRTTMLEVMRADYMRTAAAKGLAQRQIILKHGLKNAMIPVVTLVGLNLADLIGSAVLTETVFNWPGMGSEIADAIRGLDAPIVLGLTTVVVIAYVFINLAVDLSYAFFDPRIRFGREAAR